MQAANATNSADSTYAKNETQKTDPLCLSLRAAVA